MRKEEKKLKVVILAGGHGTRISEYTKTIPKPMIKICGKPIIHRIIDHYYNYGHNEFYIALGYKGHIIKNYFKKKKLNKYYNVKLIDTGKNTMTGGRLKKLSKFLNEDFVNNYSTPGEILNLIDFANKNDIDLLNHELFESKLCVFTKLD